jgi:hypothetical protein
MDDISRAGRLQWRLERRKYPFYILSTPAMFAPLAGTDSCGIAENIPIRLTASSADS